MHYSPFLVHLDAEIKETRCAYVTELGAGIGSWSELIPRPCAFHVYEEQIIMGDHLQRMWWIHQKYNPKKDVVDMVFSSRFLSRARNPTKIMRSLFDANKAKSIIHHVLAPGTKEQLFYGEVLRNKDEWQALVAPDEIIEFPGSFILKWRINDK